MFRQYVWVVVLVILFFRSYEFYLSVVARVFINNNASKKINRILFTASSMRSGRHIENGTAADKGEVGGREKN